MHRLAIIDDNETWCFVLSLRLKQQGYAVSTFTDPQSFLRQADQFDLVLVDFSIPSPRYQQEMDGPEVICHLKDKLDDPPILILISSFFPDDVLKEVEEICPEADAILSKQTDLPELLALIQKLLAKRKTSEKRSQKSLVF